MEVRIRLAWARFLIKFVKFSWWKHTLGPIDGEPDPADWPDLSPQQLKQASDTGRIVNRVADQLRLFEAVCLPRAMATRWALARRGIPSRIIIGSRRGEAEEGLLFHAWLMVGDRVITGQNERDQFLQFRKRNAEAQEARSNAA